MAKRAQPEREIQIKLVKELRKHCPYVFFAVPNGGKRDIRVATKLKAEGVQPGVTDLVFCLPQGRFAGLELKAGKNGLTPHQTEFKHRVQALQGWWKMANSYDEARVILETWGCLPSGSKFIGTSNGDGPKTS